MNKQMFQHTIAECADDFIMAQHTWDWKKVLNHFETTESYVNEIIFKPNTSQIRITIVTINQPLSVNKYTEVLNVESSPVNFLRQMWDVGTTSLNNAIKTYILQSDIKAQFVEGQRQQTADGRYEYTPMPEDERTWLMTTILGARRD